MRSRKQFNATCALPPNVGTSVLSLMQGAPLYWTYESSAQTAPSMDSTIGSELGLVPQAQVYVGSDSNVRNVNAGSFYQGVPVNPGQNYSLQDFGKFGIIDPSQVFLWNQSGCDVSITFQGR